MPNEKQRAIDDEFYKNRLSEVNTIILTEMGINGGE